MNPYLRVSFITALVASGSYAFAKQAEAGSFLAMLAVAAIAIGMFTVIGGVRPAYYMIWAIGAVVGLVVYIVTGAPISFMAIPAVAIYLTLKFIVLFGDRRR